MYNTIILVHGTGEITAKGDCLFGVDSNATEIKRWSIQQADEANAELAKYRCSYQESDTFIGATVLQADEWGLEYCECDGNGEFINGSDFVLAETED